MSDDKSLKPDDQGARIAPTPAVTTAGASGGGSGAGTDTGEASTGADAHAGAGGMGPAADSGSGGGSGSSVFAGLVPKLAIVVAVLASLIAGALWWQYRQFYVELDNADEFLLESIEGARANLRRLDDELGSLGEDLARNSDDLGDLRTDLERIPVDVRALERRVEALQGGRLDARDTWLREQAEYYLVLANSELGLARRVDNAIAALTLADGVLRDLGDPSLVDVRAAIAAERQALRAVDEPDLEGLALRLRGLGESAGELPLRAGAPTNYGDPDEALEDVEPGLGRLWASTRAAVGSIVRVERQDEPVGPLLTDEERRIVRRQLDLELSLARAAVLGRRAQDLRASLVAADQLLFRDYERSAPAVIEFRRELGNLMQVELAPALPDISDSLMLLRAARGD